jgi:hypothetical protein
LFSQWSSFRFLHCVSTSCSNISENVTTCNHYSQLWDTKIIFLCIIRCDEHWNSDYCVGQYSTVNTVGQYSTVHLFLHLWTLTSCTALFKTIKFEKNASIIRTHIISENQP